MEIKPKYTNGDSVFVNDGGDIYESDIEAVYDLKKKNSDEHLSFYYGVTNESGDFRCISESRVFISRQQLISSL